MGTEDSVVGVGAGRAEFCTDCAHASGHASHKEIMDIVRQSGAKTIFPVHTQYPEMFRESGMKIALVEKGEKREV